jgi:hypothetical protein
MRPSGRIDTSLAKDILTMRIALLIASLGFAAVANAQIPQPRSAARSRPR